MNNRGIQQFIRFARRLPPKYWVVLGAVALVYFFAQPKLEALLGRPLPGFNNSQTTVAAENDVPKANANASSRKQSDESFENNRAEQSPSVSASKDDAKRTSTANAPRRSTNESAAEPGRSKSQPKLGELTEVGLRVFESTAGLLYTPGSQEGHRIDHLLRHTEDQPNRQGPHGVFDGGREGMLAALDEAYLLALKGGRSVQREKQDNRTVYTVDLKRRIGFIGGQSGGRKNNPSVNRVRLVLEGKKVITAYPYR